MACSMRLRAALAAFLVSTSLAKPASTLSSFPSRDTADSPSTSPALTVSVDTTAGNYTVSLDGIAWLSSPSIVPTVCVAGNTSVPLTLVSSSSTSGTDAFGAWTGVTLTYETTDTSATPVLYTFQSYAPALPSVAVFTASFPSGLNTAGCGSNVELSTRFPSIDTGAARASTLSALTWASTVLQDTVTAQGLANLKSTGELDIGPPVLYDPTTPSMPGLVLSTLNYHKIIVQNTDAPPVPSPVVALWSATRSDQLACVSQLCFSDQVADGNYTQQRTEGWAIQAGGASAAADHVLVSFNGREYAGITMMFAWSQQHVDNWAGTNGSAPDSTYSIMGGDGVVFADDSVQGTIPLVVFSKNYGSRTDWAAVASSAGLQWASSNGYTQQYTAGWIWAAQPNEDDVKNLRVVRVPRENKESLSSSTSSSSSSSATTAAAAAAVFSMGLAASIPSIPAGWSYSVLANAAYGGPTAITYAWGKAIQSYSGTSRNPSVTLEKIGYYTDDGAYYYVWEAFSIPARPWPAEEGLLLVAQDLISAGVPIAFMQLDDWWYGGPFYFGAYVLLGWFGGNEGRTRVFFFLLFCSRIHALLSEPSLSLTTLPPVSSARYPPFCSAGNGTLVRVTWFLRRGKRRPDSRRFSSSAP